MLIQKLSVLTVLTKLTCDSVLNVHLFCSTLHYYLIFGVKQLSQHMHPYQRDAEKIPTNQKLKTGGKLST